MNKEICSCWNETLKRCEGIREKCDGKNPKSGKQCRFYKTIAQKKIDDKRTIARLKEVGLPNKTEAYESVEFRKNKYKHER